MKLLKPTYSTCMFTFLLSLFILLPRATAQNSVERCSNKSNRCVVKMNEGYRGQKINVLDETARKIGSGIILKRRGEYVLIKITNFTKKIRKNFVVTLAPHEYCYNKNLSIQYLTKQL